MEPAPPSPLIKDEDVPMATAVVSGSGAGVDAIRKGGLEVGTHWSYYKPVNEEVVSDERLYQGACCLAD